MDLKGFVGDSSSKLTVCFTYDDKRGEMMSNEGQQRALDEQPETDSANNELGPTDKLREHDSSAAELSVPGAQNPASDEIKNEQNPNTE